MASMNIHTATEKIKTFLVANLVDPLNERTTAWIYSDNMRIDLDKSPYPKILLKKKDEPSLKPLLAIGNIATENTDQIFIEIKTLAGNNYTDNDTDIDYTATAFAALIAQKAEDLIKQNHDYFVSVGFLHVIMTQDIIEDDRDKNPIYRLGIEMKYISSPN